MNELYVAARAIHYASAMLLFGGVLFGFVIAGRAWSGAPGVVAHCAPGDRRTLLIAGYSAIVLSLASGAAWLVIQAALMTGAPPGGLPSLETLERVLGKTIFGRIWILRFGLLVALCVLLPIMAGSSRRKR